MQKTFSCPVCGTRYRHKGMAARCQRTDVCRWYHAPGGERRRAYALQVRVCAAVAYICAPVSAQARVAEVEAQAWKALHLVDQIIDGLDTLSVSRDIYRRVNDAAIRDLESIWAPTSTVDVVHIVAIVASVVADLRRELADWLAARPETDALWRDMEHAVDGLYDLFDPEGTENYEHADDVPRLYAALRRKVFGPEKAAPQARLYLLGGRFWVAAYTKADARDHLRRELGLVGLKAQGVALGEKLDDGRSAADLLALAQTVPCILGRTG